MTFHEEKIHVSYQDLKLQVPSKCLLIGPSGSGKTTFILELLKKKFFQEDFSEIFVCLPAGAGNMLDETIENYQEASPGIKIHFGLINCESIPQVSLFCLFQTWLPTWFQTGFFCL